MDLSILFNIILLVFALALIGAVVYIPYKMLQYFIRGIFRTTVKTVDVIFTSVKK